MGTEFKTDVVHKKTEVKPDLGQIFTYHHLSGLLEANAIEYAQKLFLTRSLLGELMIRTIQFPRLFSRLGEYFVPVSHPSMFLQLIPQAIIYHNLTCFSWKILLFDFHPRCGRCKHLAISGKCGCGKICEAGKSSQM